MERYRKGILLVIFSAIIFGLNPLIAKTVYINGGNPVSLTSYRMLFGSISLFLAQKFLVRGKIFPEKKIIPKLVLCSLFYGGTPVILLTSYHYLASGVATTIHFIYPVFVLIGSLFLFHAKITKIKLLCCFLCMIGIISFYTPGDGNFSPKGMILALVSGVTYAGYIILLAKSGFQSMSPYKTGAWLCFFAMIVIVIISIISNQVALNMTLTGWILSVLYGFVSSGIANVAFINGNKLVGPQAASLLSTFEPLTSVFVDVVVYDESFTLRSVIGILSILASVIIVAKYGRE